MGLLGADRGHQLLRTSQKRGSIEIVPKVKCLTQRAQRTKKFDLDRNFQSRSKSLISLENFDLDVSISPQKMGPRWVARSKISFSIEIFNLDRNLEFF